MKARSPGARALISPEMKLDDRIDEGWQACRMDVARIAALVVILSALVAAPAWSRGQPKSANHPDAEVQESADPDDTVVEYIDEQRDAAGSAEVTRSSAAPPRTVDDIT